MAWSFYKTKVYAKLTGIIIMFLAVLLFILDNGESMTVDFLFWQTKPLPKYLFIIIVALLGWVVVYVLRRVHRVIAEVKLLRREENTRRKLVNEVKNDINKQEPQK